MIGQMQGTGRVLVLSISYWLDPHVESNVTQQGGKQVADLSVVKGTAGLWREISARRGKKISNLQKRFVTYKNILVC